MKKWTLPTTLVIVTPLHAQTVTSPVAQASAMSDGVVRKIDASNGKLTLRHGPITNLEMPPMTMVSGSAARLDERPEGWRHGEVSCRVHRRRVYGDGDPDRSQLAGISGRTCTPHSGSNNAANPGTC